MSNVRRVTAERLTAAWAAPHVTQHDKADITEILQRAGIPAGPMNRAVDVPTDPQVAFRQLYTDMTHPLFDAPMLSETRPAPYTGVPAADLRPAHARVGATA